MSLALLIGKRIKESRESLHLTKVSFAEHVGISESYISKIEQGSKLPKVDVLIEICKALSVTTDYILFGCDMTYEEQVAKILLSCSDEEKEIIIKTAQALKQALKEKQECIQNTQ